jgi:hypothetical protein
MLQALDGLSPELFQHPIALQLGNHTICICYADAGVSGFRHGRPLLSAACAACAACLLNKLCDCCQRELRTSTFVKSTCKLRVNAVAKLSRADTEHECVQSNV